MLKLFIFLFFLILVFIIKTEIVIDKMKQKYNGNMNIDGHIFQTNTLNNNTDIVYLTNFLSKNECTHIIKEAEGNFKRSTTVGEPKSKGRTSYTCFLNSSKNDNDKILKKITNRISVYLNVDSCQIEDLQVVRYNPGQKYDYHYDWFKDKYIEEGGKENKRGRQRLYTIFVYLNTLDEEGNNGKCNNVKMDSMGIDNTLDTWAQMWSEHNQSVNNISRLVRNTMLTEDRYLSNKLAAMRIYEDSLNNLDEINNKKNCALLGRKYTGEPNDPPDGTNYAFEISTICDVAQELKL